MYFATKMYMDTHKDYADKLNLRFHIIMKIMEFDRFCSFIGKLDNKAYSIVFPWDTANADSQLPSLEESVKKFKEMKAKKATTV